MTIYSEGSDNTRENSLYIRKTCALLHQIIDLLSGFKDNYSKKFNIYRLAQYLELTTGEIEECISVLLDFQDQLHTIFDEYVLKKKVENAQLYLVAQKKTKRVYAIPKIIHLSQTQLDLFNDIVYMFKHVRKGKGFSYHINGTEIIKNITLLRDTHPYLFETWENELIYPSQFGLKLGELIISYNMSNKKIENIELDDTTIIVDTHG